MDVSESFITLCALVRSGDSIRVLEEYLARIRDVNEIDDQGHSPLWYASTHNRSIEVITTLLRAQAKVTYEILCDAILAIQEESIVHLLYHTISPLSQKELDRLFLLSVATQEHDRLVRFFLSEGASIEAVMEMDLYPKETYAEDEEEWVSDEESVKQNALVVAIYENPNPIDMMKTLISSHVDINAIDSEGVPVLFHALDSLEMVQLLLAEGVDIEITDRNGMTALMQACAAEHIEVALALMNASANIHTRCRNGNNALHYALYCHLGDNYTVVKELIARGADIHRPDGEGLLPIEIARLNFCSQRIIDLLTEIIDDAQHVT